jgi:divalent metal cation (Fe/Co/Zn/Cd) transporter
MLFTLGGAFSIWEGVRHYLHPSERQSLAWAYGVLGGGFVFESIALGVALRSLWRAKGTRSVRDYWRDTRDPTLITIVCEDTAALSSLVIAAAGITLGAWTGSVVWDAAASALIGLILIAVAVFLAVESYSLLLGETAPPHVERTIDRVVEEERTVRAVRDLRTMHLGPHSLLIVVSVEFAEGLDTAGIEAGVSRLHARLTEALGDTTDGRLIVIEPAPDPARTRRAA